MTTNPTSHDPGSTELCTATPPTPPVSTRPDRASGRYWSVRADRRIAWIGHHSLELAGLIAPAFLAAWFWHWPSLVVSAAVAVLWAGHEYRQHKSDSARPAALTPDQADGTQTAPSDKEATRGLA